MSFLVGRKSKLAFPLWSKFIFSSIKRSEIRVSTIYFAIIRAKRRISFSSQLFVKTNLSINNHIIFIIIYLIYFEFLFIVKISTFDWTIKHRDILTGELLVSIKSAVNTRYDIHFYFASSNRSYCRITFLANRNCLIIRIVENNPRNLMEAS